MGYTLLHCYVEIQYIPYNQKFWRSLNLAVWPQTKRKKVLAKFKLGGGASAVYYQKFKVKLIIYIYIFFGGQKAQQSRKESSKLHG